VLEWYVYLFFCGGVAVFYFFLRRLVVEDVGEDKKSV
jgi:hypothetical protein